VFLGAFVRSKINLQFAGTLFAALFVAIGVMVPSARPDDLPEGQVCAKPAAKGTDAELRVCRDHQDNGAAQDSTGAEAKKKPRLITAWLALGERVQDEQPDWLSPLATTSGRLKNEFRYDVWDQPSAGSNNTWQFGGNKGLEFITSSRTQVLIGVPMYTLVTPNGPPGGSGDLPLMLKFRIASAERREGNYLLTFILAATAPTGSHRYGSGEGVLTPTMAFGKGWGNFDVQSTVGMNLPTGNTLKLGRQVMWNTALQYRAKWKLWPEVEANTTFYDTGKYAGNTQLFLTPGLGFGRAHLAGRFRFSSAVGMQIAATHFHTYDHRLMISTRFSF
jgi:hypothetical protein